jgi:hypothetical protein
MSGFCQIVTKLLTDNGLSSVQVMIDHQLELPGYFRPTKMWDMLILHNGSLLAALEFKSQRGPSFSNNFNNRAEESVGIAHDLWTANREKAFGETPQRPWLGWLMLLEDCDESNKPVDVNEPHFPIFPEFRDASYAKRYELLLRKLRLERLYDGTSLLLASELGGLEGKYTEPAKDLRIESFLAGLVGHIAGSTIK